MITQQKVNSFLLLAEELNFSRAAQKLYISQQALSAQISALENDLGFPLFVRTTKSVRLTEAGERTADFFRRSAAELQSLTAAYRKSVGTLLRIGCFLLFFRVERLNFGDIVFRAAVVALKLAGGADKVQRSGTAGALIVGYLCWHRWFHLFHFLP